MMKATHRRAVLLGVVTVGMFGLSIPSFAEVQNVKVGGDLTVRAFHRQNLDLNRDDDANDEQNFVMQSVALNVAADLTENVSAMIRFANESDWSAAIANDLSSGDVDVSQAYVTLKELFYSPLTLRVGTQPIKWGRGLVLGSNLLPSILSTGSFTGGDRNNAIAADEYTDFTAFNGVRATLDLGTMAGDMAMPPLVLDTVYIKLDENTQGRDDDTNLLGFNLGAKFDSMNSEAEWYYLNKRDRSVFKHGSVSTLGLRGSASPVENAWLYSELAYQFGKDAAALDGGGLPTGIPHQAWLANLGIEFLLADAAMSPKIGAEWLFKSGRNKDGALYGWDAIAPSYFPTLIRSYQVRSTDTGGLYPVDQAGVTAAFTNQHDLALYGSLKPIEDLTVDARLTWFIQDVGSIGAAATDSKRNRFLGTEFDKKWTYQYTDDVTLALAYGIFWPGNTFRATSAGTPVRGDNIGQTLITEASLKF